MHVGIDNSDCSPGVHDFVPDITTGYNAKGDCLWRKTSLMTHNSPSTPLGGWGSLGICFFALDTPLVVQWRKMSF